MSLKGPFAFLLPPAVFSVRIRVLYTCLELEAREVSAASGRDHRRISTAFSKNSQSIIMADHLAQIFGTEKDRVNCPFYFKIGTVAGLGRCVLCVVCCVLCVAPLPAARAAPFTLCTLHAARLDRRLMSPRRPLFSSAQQTDNLADGSAAERLHEPGVECAAGPRRVAAARGPEAGAALFRGFLRGFVPGAGQVRHGGEPVRVRQRRRSHGRECVCQVPGRGVCGQGREGVARQVLRGKTDPGGVFTRHGL